MCAYQLLGSVGQLFTKRILVFFLETGTCFASSHSSCADLRTERLFTLSSHLNRAAAIGWVMP